MANLTAERDTRRLLMEPSSKQESIANNNSTIFKGGMVGIDASTGLLIRGGGVLAGFSGALVGVAQSSISGTHTGESIEYRTGVFGFDHDGLTAANINTVVYADDDQTLSDDDGNVAAGILVRIEDGVAFVQMGFQNLSVDSGGGQ